MYLFEVFVSFPDELLEIGGDTVSPAAKDVCCVVCLDDFGRDHADERVGEGMDQFGFEGRVFG